MLPSGGQQGLVGSGEEPHGWGGTDDTGDALPAGGEGSVPGIPVQDSPALNWNVGIAYRLTQRHPSTQGIRAVSGASLTAPHLSTAASTSGSAPHGFGSFLTLSSPLQGCSLPCQDSGREELSLLSTHGRLCLPRAGAESRTRPGAGA